MVDVPFAATTPIRVARVGLKARNADGLAAYYKKILGLNELSRSAGRMVLGAGGRPLMEIEESASAREDDPRSAGLYHTAFLLPARADLARWTRFAIDERIPVVGASDHLVSEAIYLTDPEGNGVEIYADRPREGWSWDGDFVRMGTEQLDIGNLLGEIRNDDVWKGAPEASVIGHFHLRVGDAAVAEKWWNGEMGFDTVQSRRQCRIPVDRRLPSSYRGQFLAEPWRRPARRPAHGPDVGRTGGGGCENRGREAGSLGNRDKNGAGQAALEKAAQAAPNTRLKIVSTCLV